MFILLTIIHVIVSLFLIIVVLLQSGKAADLAGAFGGMGSQTVFGPRGSATVLTRATTASAVLFMVTSLSLAVMSSSRIGTGGGSPSILDPISGPATTTSGQAPAPAPGTQVPIQVTPSVNGVKGETQTIPATVIDKNTPVPQPKGAPVELPAPKK